jgi:hypothetical protein
MSAFGTGAPIGRTEKGRVAGRSKRVAMSSDFIIQGFRYKVYEKMGKKHSRGRRYVEERKTVNCGEFAVIRKSMDGIADLGAGVLWGAALTFALAGYDPQMINTNI